MKKNIILGIDTTGENCNVALAENGEVLDEISTPTPQDHSSKLIPFIDKILKSNNLIIKDVAGIAISVGPGSFTGLKVGVATAKTLAQALGIPIVGIYTLDVIALNAVDHGLSTMDGFVCVITDARKEQVYNAKYSVKCQVSSVKLKKLMKDSVMTIEDLLLTMKHGPSTIFTGNGIKLYGDKIKDKLKDKVIFTEEKHWYPKASNTALEGYKKLQKNKKGDNLFKLNPLYVRQPDIGKKK